MSNWITADDTSALLDSLASTFASVVGGLAGAEPSMTVLPATDRPEWAADALLWQQGFDIWPSARLALGATAESWRGLGVAPLVALGEVAGADDETARGTFLEYLSQTCGALGSALSGQAGAQVLPVNGQEGAPWPDGWTERGVEFRLGDGAYTVWFAVAPDFFADARSKMAAAGTPDATSEGPGLSEAHGRSGTFDLLLEVELGVSISFGRAMVPLREVARLTSGSVVELNRTVSDPVEVIVNNCVIARGEVVVVEGNYGVRIQQIISPRERLRTLH